MPTQTYVAHSNNYELGTARGGQVTRQVRELVVHSLPTEQIDRECE